MKRSYMAEPWSNRPRLLFICGLGLCLISIGVPEKCFAQNAIQASVLPITDVALFPLSNTDIASVKGTGLQAPSLSRASTPMGTITLWDELKPLAQQQNVLSGTQVITVNGVAQ